MADGPWFLDRLPSLSELSQILGSNPIEVLTNTARGRAPVEMGYLGKPEGLADDPKVQRLFALAVQATDRLKQNRLAKLNADEEGAMHLFVHLMGRPAFRTMEGDIPTVTENWVALSNARSVVIERLKGVGRLDTAGKQECGTGWFIAKDLVITNNHVVAALCGINPHRDGEWRQKLNVVAPAFSSNWEANVSARPWWNPGDLPPNGAPIGRVRKIRALHAFHDAALLEVEGVPETQRLVLQLIDTDPATEEGLVVYVAGYPAAFDGVTHPALLSLLFGGASQAVTKRVSPGKVLGRELAEHDASTLGGSSGSPVIGLSDHRVRALHFSGKYGVANYAVPFCKLKNDPFLTDHDIQVPSK